VDARDAVPVLLRAERNGGRASQVPPQGLELDAVRSVDGASKPEPQKFEDVDDVG
jgi:hypothetical protein